jgi:tetratricopeptide (TPR) repeat protein
MILREFRSIRNIPTRVRKMLEYASKLYANEPEQAIVISREVIRLTENTKLLKECADAHRVIALSYFKQSKFKDALVELDKAINIYTKLNLKELIARTLQNIGIMHRRIGQNLQALQAYSQSEKLFEQVGDKQNRSLVLLSIGNLHTILDNPLKAFESYSECLEILEEINDTDNIGIVIGNIGNLYTKLGDYEKAFQWSERSLMLHKQMGYQRGIAFALCELGLLYSLTGKRAKARECYDEALVIYEETNDLTGQASIHNDLSQFYLDTEKYVIALKNAESARILYEQANDTQNRATMYDRIGDIYSKKNDYASALQSYQQAVELISKTENYAHYSAYLYKLAVCTEHTGDYQLVLKLLEESLQLALDHELLERQYLIYDKLSFVYEAVTDLPKALKYSRMSSEAKAQYSTQITSRQIQDLKYRLDIEQVQSEREMLRLQGEQYRIQLEAKNNELNVSALALASKNEVLTTIKRRLTSMQNSIKDLQHADFHELISDVDTHVRSDAQMQGITKELSDFHQDFIQKLTTEFPTLTRTELKICSLLKLNLNTKEIADFMCVSFKSVEVYRAKVRKKLGLEEGENLTAFLIGYDSTI